jgi:hypothetical protein
MTGTTQCKQLVAVVPSKHLQLISGCWVHGQMTHELWKSILDMAPVDQNEEGVDSECMEAVLPAVEAHPFASLPKTLQVCVCVTINNDGFSPHCIQLHT